jgi:hypothetical protein
MEQLVELLKQIQELAGVAIDALEGAGGEKPEGGDKPPADGPPPEGPPPGEGGPPPEQR